MDKKPNIVDTPDNDPREMDERPNTSIDPDHRDQLDLADAVEDALADAGLSYRIESVEPRDYISSPSRDQQQPLSADIELRVFRDD